MPLRVVGLEEHFVTTPVLDAWSRLEPRWRDLSLAPSASGESGRLLAELGPERFAAMEETGLDVQVLSLTAPGVHNLEPRDAVALAGATNDLMAETIASHPDRLRGFATLATPAPEQAAAELERAVTTLGLDGGMLFGRTRDRNLDHPDNLPIFEAAAALGAPLYLHPQSPPPAVRNAYYSGFGDAVDTAFATHALGWHYESGVQLVRLILSGIFDRLPELQVVVGHWGEVVLFYLERVEQIRTVVELRRPITDYVRSNVLVTPSGMLSDRYLRWAVEVIGADRILFSTDYPFVPASRHGARRFLDDADLTDSERQAIASGNWERLTSAIRR